MNTFVQRIIIQLFRSFFLCTFLFSTNLERSDVGQTFRGFDWPKVFDFNTLNLICNFPGKKELNLVFDRGRQALL